MLCANGWLGTGRPFLLQTLQRTPTLCKPLCTETDPVPFSPALRTWPTVPIFQNSVLISTVTCSCREKQDTFSYLKSRHKKIRLLGLQAPEEKTESALFAPDNSAKIPWGLTVRLMRNSPATPI